MNQNVCIYIYMYVFNEDMNIYMCFFFGKGIHNQEKNCDCHDDIPSLYGLNNFSNWETRPLAIVHRFLVDNTWCFHRDLWRNLAELEEKSAAPKKSQQPAKDIQNQIPIDSVQKLLLVGPTVGPLSHLQKGV